MSDWLALYSTARQAREHQAGRWLDCDARELPFFPTPHNKKSKLAQDGDPQPIVHLRRK